MFFRACAYGVAALLVATAQASAQTLPSEPVTFGNGRVTIGGDVSVSASTNKDDPGWFNYTDYEHNTLRLIRLGFSATVRAGDHVSMVGELRSENWDTLTPYALYVRVRPWSARSFDIQAGRIPPTFGAFARRSYAIDNPLIGYPLAYQYLTSIRPDALPASADDLLRMRGRGWRASYPLGSETPAGGLPLVTAFRWDTGVQIHVGSEPVELSAAVTAGTLGDPQVQDDNGGKQLSARIGVKPVVGLVIGVSAARGPYLSRAVTSVLPPGAGIGDFTQRALGFDAEYSRGYWLVRAEAVMSEWRLPAIAAPLVSNRLRAASASIEGRYKLRPGLYIAGRADHLGFNRVTGTQSRLTWDAPVSRIEVGGGYYVTRNVTAKLVYQRNWRDSARFRSLGIAAAQLQFWF